MFKRFATAAIFVTLTACSAGTSTGGDPDTIACEGGKCDAYAPRALESISTAFGQCTVTPDTQTTDEFYAVDTVDCRFINFDASAGVKLNSVTVEARELATERYHSGRFSDGELDGAAKGVARVRVEGYPLRIDASPIAYVSETYSRLADPQLNGEYVTPKVTADVLERPTAPMTVDFDLPFEVWEVGVWPTKEFAAKMSAGDYDFGYLTVTSEFKVGDQTESAKHYRTFRPADDLSLLSNTVFTIPKGDGIALVEMKLDSTDYSAGLASIEGPGYFLIEADGSLTPATPQDIEARGMFADDAAPPAPDENPDVEQPPVEDPVDPEPDADPCAGACDATEACVAAACVPLEDQRQVSCNSTPTAACEEDADCASGNICGGGVCRLRECQTQSSSCYDPRNPCETDSDCADEHACAAGLCRRLTCQTQSSSCYDARTVCEQSSDCFDEHACVEGLCRRLTCQTQSSSCYDARAICESDDSCADGHACVEGLCRRLTCQTQSSSCYEPRAVCVADDDCADGHTCLDGTCQRLTCVN